MGKSNGNGNGDEEEPLTKKQQEQLAAELKATTDKGVLPGPGLGKIRRRIIAGQDEKKGKRGKKSVDKEKKRKG